MENLGSVTFNPLSTGFLFLCFQIRVRLEHCGKTVARIFIKFSAKVGPEIRTDLELSQDVAIKPLNSGSIFYFLDPCLVVMLQKHAWMDFHEIFTKCQTQPTNSYLDCLTSAQSVSLWQVGKQHYGKWISRFSWHFRYRLAVTRGKVWNIFGMIRLTYGILHYFFFWFLDPLLWASLRSDGWTDIPQIFRIWTQQMARLFHAWIYCNTLSGCLCSRNASCSYWDTLC